MSSVSILIPVYNREKLLVPCVESALNQTRPPSEIVIVDNASTDSTWEVSQNFARRHPHIRALQNAVNLGPVRNWKRCIDEARGENALLLFSDDLIYPTYLEKTLPYLENPQVGLVFTAVHIGVDTNQGQIAYEWSNYPPVFPSSEYIHQALTRMSTPLSPGCMLFRLRDLKENLMLAIPSPTLDDFDAHGAGPDLLLSLLTAHQYPQVAHVPEPLVLFREHLNSITVSHKQWYLYRRYQQARIWFAAEYENDQILGELLVGMWLSECYNNSQLISPAKCARQYTTRFAWSWRTAAQMALERFRKRFLRV